jgi:DNA-binding transcriptional MerR regulator
MSDPNASEDSSSVRANHPLLASLHEILTEDATEPVVVPHMRRRRRRYRARDVERVLRDLAGQVEVFRRAQTERALEHLSALIAATGADLERARSEAEHVRAVARDSAESMLAEAERAAGTMIVEARRELARLNDEIERIRLLAVRLAESTAPRTGGPTP